MGKYQTDFDIAWDAFEKDGEPVPIEAELRRVAKRHGVEVDSIDYCGPGGGNPCVTVTAPDRDTAERFVRDFTRDPDYARDAVRR